MSVQGSPLSTGRFLLPLVLTENSAHTGFDYQTHTTQTNLNGISTGVGRASSPLPNAVFLPSLCSLLQVTFGLQHLKESGRLILVSGKHPSIFTLLLLEKIGETSYQTFQKHFPPLQVECSGVSSPGLHSAKARRVV